MILLIVTAMYAGGPCPRLLDVLINDSITSAGSSPAAQLNLRLLLVEGALA